MKTSEMLRGLTKHPKFDETMRICDNFRVCYGESNVLEFKMYNAKIKFEEWEGYSGKIISPVPDTIPWVVRWRDGESQWKRTSKHGKARRALLKWLIEQFEIKGD